MPPPRTTTVAGSVAGSVARGAAAIVAIVRRLAGVAPPPAPHTLAPVQRRLELLVGALYDRTVTIEAAPAHGLRTWLDWRLAANARHLRHDHAIAATDGETIHLPPTVAAPDAEAAWARYRLLALEQAERIARGTVAQVPSVDARLERDLYLLCEGAAVDRALGDRLRSVQPAIDAARIAALDERPAVDELTPAERAVEALVRRALGEQLLVDGGTVDGGMASSGTVKGGTASGGMARVGTAGAVPTLAMPLDDVPLRTMPPDAMPPSTVPPLTGIPPIPSAPSPAESRQWAREAAARIAASARTGRDVRYRGVSPVALWGAARDPAPPDDRLMDTHPVPSDGDASHGAASLAPQPTSQGERGATAPAEPTVAVMEEGPRRGAMPPIGAGRITAEYPEWDGVAHRYRPRAVTVHQWRAPEEESPWAHDTLREHAAVVRRVRERFERLRAQRIRLRHQRDGEEIDIAACVRAAVDRRLGHAIDDRLYASVRPARRGLAIALLIDVSGSTDTPVGGARQIIDVEKTSALLACEALEALGDPYAVLAFSSRGPRQVWMRVVKDFAERHGDAVRRRIGALAPEANTRLGAAIRHTTALLARQPAGHRLLLVVSDGRPNDVDHYQERFAVEDSRQAMAEARAAGVHPFCLTVDREQSDYLPRIFGPAGYTIMRQPDHLPMALLKGVRDLLGA